MGQVINIFTGKEIKRIKSQDEIIAEIHDDLIQISQHLFDCLDEEIVEIGKHSNLLKNRSRYFELWNMQLKAG